MSGRGLRVGLTQWHPTLDVAENAGQAVRAIETCGQQEAQLIVLPENGLCLGTNAQMRERALTIDDPAVHAIRAAAGAAQAAVVLGGMKRRDPEGIVHNSALVIGPDGVVAAIYDKIHLFTARVGGQTFDAASVETAGDQPLVIDVAGVRVGVTICFDVRFPELYRTLTRSGAEVLLVPAAFAQATGAAHWETLLRARAIENAAYVVASATISGAEDPMATYGHAMTVSPWGDVLADLGREPFACEVLQLDLDRRAELLGDLPVLDAARPEASATAPATVVIDGVHTTTSGATHG